MNLKEIVQDLVSKAGNPLTGLTRDLNLNKSNKILDSFFSGATEPEKLPISDDSDPNLLKKDQTLNPPIRPAKKIINMSLKEIAKLKFMEDVINDIRNEHDVEMLAGAKVKMEFPKYRFLIVDDHTMKIVSAVTSFSELSKCGILLVQNIGEFRDTHPTNEAIYFITPTEKNISGNF